MGRIYVDVEIMAPRQSATQEDPHRYEYDAYHTSARIIKKLRASKIPIKPIELELGDSKRTPSYMPS